MIVGVFLRYIKTYQGINYIPLTDSDQFCGLVGDNGIGKSSVLEALDCFFNGKNWNINTQGKKSGLNSSLPHIVPVFLVNKKEVPSNLVDFVAKISHLAMSIESSHASNDSVKKKLESFIVHRDKLKNNFDFNDFYLLPVGLSTDGSYVPSISIFNCRYAVEILSDSEVAVGNSYEDTTMLEAVVNYFKSNTEYIYIPREIDPELFTKLETEEIQILMGETLHQILAKLVPDNKVKEINRDLNKFIDTLSAELEDYSYRNSGERQKGFKKADLYNLIIQAFFSIRKLHKKQAGSWLEISKLSSGEKQRAIIEVAHGFLKNHRDDGDKLIIAIDEPESSLHMSACYDQFDSLYEVSRQCNQLIFSTHWYGFLPTVESGCATVITKKESSHLLDLINLSSYREQVRQEKVISKGKIPFDIRLKSINDFVQSVITGSTGTTPINWIICEGSSEKIYFNHYFKDEIKSNRLRVVPVGGATEIKKFYNYISTSYEDFKSEVLGKIIMISDTDSDFVNYTVNNDSNLICKRVVSCNKSKKTILVDIQSNPKSPETEIEDSLNGFVFYLTLLEFKDAYPIQLSFLDNIVVSDQEDTYFSLGFRPNEKESLKEFFNLDNNKYKFAKKYIEILEQSDEVLYKTPDWILEIKQLLS